MKNLFGLLSLGLLLSFISCKQNDYSGNYQKPSTTTISTPTTNIGDNLDLQALADLVRSSNSAEDIENKLNSDGSINNLDIDQDGNVDYISVVESGSGNNRRFEFNVGLPDGTNKNVANIDLTTNNGQVAVDVRGNESYYGHNNYHSNHYSASDVLLMSYLLNSHRPYYSPYGYNHYPRTYTSYRSVPVTSYRTKVVRTTRTRTTTRPSSYTSSKTTTTRPISTTSYTKNTTTTKPTNTSFTARRNSVLNSTTSQKSFRSTRTANTRPSTTGFRSSSSSSSSYSSKPRSSSSSSWGSSSSSTRRSSSSSSGSSWGSSSSSSRRSSSGFGSSSSSRSSSSSSRRR